VQLQLQSWWRFEGQHKPLQFLKQFGLQVEQGGTKHVTGQAADGIEAEVSQVFP
jgi:hypothetical protein